MVDVFEDVPDDFFDVVFSEETEKILSKIENVTSLPSDLLIFDCLGETSHESVELSRNGYFRKYDNLFSLDQDDSVSQVNFFGRSVDRGALLQVYLDDFFRLAAKEFMLLESDARITFGSQYFNRGDSKKNYLDKRKNFVEFLHFVLCYVHRLRDRKYISVLVPTLTRISKKLNSVENLLGTVYEIPDHVRQFCANSAGNKCTQASYHLLHAHLDLRWLHLLIVYAISVARLNSEEISPDSLIPDSQVVSKTTESLIRQLFNLSILRFNKIELQDVMKKTPFGCTCIQELWLLMNKFISCREKEIGKSFWDHIDTLLNSISSNRQESHEAAEDEVILPVNNLVFSVWFLFHIGRLCKYNNESKNHYQLLENVLKQSIVDDIKESNLRIVLLILEKMCIHLWDPKSEPVLVIWEYYQKRLNESFYIPGHKLDSCSVIAKDGQSLLERSRNLLEDSSVPANSFEKFLRITGLHLQRSSGNPRHWNLIKGRIYSKLTLPRLMGLTQTGEHHTVLLLIVLALSGNTEEVATRMCELLEGCLKGKGVSEELFKGGLAMAILLIQRNCPIYRIAPILVSCIESSKNSLARQLVNALPDVIDAPLGLGQHLLFEKWLSDYLSSSEPSRLLDVIHSLTNSMSLCDLSHDHIVMLEKLWAAMNIYIESHISDLSTPALVADISLNFAVLFYKLSEMGRFNEIVALFLRNESCEIRLARRFICHLLDSEVSLWVSDINELLVKIWIRSGLVCEDTNHEEIKRLSREVSKMKEIQNLCDGKVSGIADSDEPLLEFVMSFSAKFNSVQDIFQRQKLREQVTTYFGGIEKWVKPLVSPPLFNLDTVERVFFLIGNIIRLVSPLLYLKSKPNNIVQSLLNITLLPLSVHNPDFKMHPFLLSAARKTLHLFIEGLLKLNPQYDHYISRSIKELISVYVPRCLSNSGAMPSHLQISTFSLITLFNEFSTEMSKTILTVLCETFLKSKARNPHQNSLQVLVFIKETNKLYSWNERVLSTLIECTFKSILCTAIFCDEKSIVNSTAKELVAELCRSVGKSKCESVKGKTVEVLSKFAKENLPWTSRQVFDILCFMTAYSPELIRTFSPFLLRCIQEVESLRGVGYDRLLRLGFERIQSKIMSLKENIS